MPLNLDHLAHYLCQHFAIFCGPVNLSLSSISSSLVETSETEVDEITVFIMK